MPRMALVVFASRDVLRLVIIHAARYKRIADFFVFSWHISTFLCFTSRTALDRRAHRRLLEGIDKASIFRFNIFNTWFPAVTVAHLPHPDALERPCVYLLNRRQIIRVAAFRQ